MSAALLAGRLLLALVLAVAGASKLADRSSFRETVRGFGLPRSAALAVPSAELAVATLLVPATTARSGAAAALALVVVFSAAVARLLARGERPDCGCFGARRATPVGGWTLGRNAVLAGVAAAVVVAGAGRGFAAPHLSPLAAVVAVVVAAVVAQACFSWQLLRQNGRLLARVRVLEQGDSAGLPVGAVAPVLALPRLPAAVVFSSTSCGACLELRPALERLRDDGLELVVVEDDPEALDAYRVSAVPSAVLVGADGRIASETVSGGPAVEELLLAAAPAPFDERLLVAAS